MKAPEAEGQTPAVKATQDRTERQRRLASIAQSIALPVAWVLVIITFGIVNPGTFLSGRNFSTIFGSQAVLVVVALGELLPLTAGDFDISVGFNLNLASVIVAVLNTEHGWPVGATILVALAAGAVIGIVNGALVVLFGIDSFVVTLGTGTLVSGVILVVSRSLIFSGISKSLTDAVIGKRFLGIPIGFYYGLVLCILLWYFFEYTPVGRRMLFVGRGRNVSRLSGISVERMRWGAFVASGVIAAFAGVLYAGNTGGADPSSGANFLLPAMAAAFLGATTIRPGRFNAWGTIVAVYFLVTGITGLQLLGAQSYIQQLFYGGALIVAVVLSQLSKRGEMLEEK